MMIPFLDLKGLNAQYRDELIEACTRVIDSGWYIQGNECKEFEKSLHNTVAQNMLLVLQMVLMLLY